MYNVNYYPTALQIVHHNVFPAPLIERGCASAVTSGNHCNLRDMNDLEQEVLEPSTSLYLNGHLYLHLLESRILTIKNLVPSMVSLL